MPQINANITWQPVTADPPVLGYKVQRGGQVGPWTDVATVGPEATTYTDSNLAAATQFKYQVAAFNAFGVGPFKAAPAFKNTGGLPPAPESVAFDYIFI